MISDNIVSADGLKLELSSAISSPVMSKLSSISSISSIPLAQLKTLMRNTSIDIDDPIRKTLWLGLALRNNRSIDVDDFDSQLDNLTVKKLPTFVDPMNARFFELNHKSRRHITTILWNLLQCTFC